MTTFMCSLNCTSFAAGDVVSIDISLPDLHPHADHVIAQVFGFLQVDERWSTVALKKGEAPPELASISHAPFIPSTRYVGLQSYIIFKTEREQLSIPSLVSGVTLSFDMPEQSLPSFSGLAGGVSYVLGLSMYKDHTYYYTKFPFHIHGIGSATFPAQRYAPLCVNITSPTQIDSDGYNTPDKSPVGITYAIRHISTICHATLSNTILRAGDAVPLRFNFMSGHGCVHMVAKVMQCEKLLNGKRLQERVLDSQRMYTEYADVINMSLQLHMNTCSFTCPAFKVLFLLEVEFSFLDEEKSKQLFTWSTPLDITPGSSVRMCNPKTSTTEAKVYVLQR